MGISEDFINYCTQTLEVNFGQLSAEIINKVKAKKSLNDTSNTGDFKEFIDVIELNLSVLSGKNKAAEICNTLRTKAVETTGRQKAPETTISTDIDKEISAFLAKNTLPSESDITDYAKYLTMKFGGNAKKVEKDIIEKVKNHVRIAISRKKVNEEIGNFLVRYSQPEQKDIDDFVNYIRLLKLNFPESELREFIEKERLYRKFHGDQEVVEKPSELDQFIDIIKTQDKNDISKAMQKQEISYLIKDESGLSDKLVSEFVELMTPNEGDMKDTLESLGLKHLIKNG
ncbi:MAG: hypothetical protein O8C66_01240 [Candidatus Methanoperedens sp.]|nr:hypothetical protein [Candidatus Methanoperedens sp.]MCZ7369112.1 hypothetical protein [Candidatus Methanoperedens sp.]